MKNFTQVFFITAILFTSCAGPRQMAPAGKDFEKAFAALQHNGSDAAVQKAQDLYNRQHQQQLARIADAATGAGETRWDKVIDAYTTLEQLHETVQTAACCSTLIRTVGYSAQLKAARQEAAAFYYGEADALAGDSSVTSIRRQGAALQRVIHFEPGYRDAAARLNQLLSSNSFVVAFNPVEDTLFFNERNFTARMFTYSNKVFVKDLVKTINTQKSGIGFLVLLSWEECQAQGWQPDWLVDLRLPQLYAATRPETRVVTRQVNEPAGTDSSGRTIYQTRMVAEEQQCEVISDARTVLQLTITNLADGRTVLRENFETTYQQPVNATNNCIGLYNDNRLSRTDEFFPLSLREYAVHIMYGTLFDQYSRKLKRLLEN